MKTQIKASLDGSMNCPGIDSQGELLSNREKGSRASRHFQAHEYSAGSGNTVRWRRWHECSMLFQGNRIDPFCGCACGKPSGSLCHKDVDRDPAARCGAELHPKSTNGTLRPNHFYAFRSNRAREPFPTRCLDLAQVLLEMIEEMDPRQGPAPPAIFDFPSQAAPSNFTRIK